MTKTKSKAKAKEAKAITVSERVNLDGDEVENPRIIVLKPRIRSSFFARFREANPSIMEAINGSISAGSEGFRASAGASVLKGLPSEEVLNICAFISECVSRVEGFPSVPDWAEKDDKADFLDLELTDPERFALLVVIYAREIGAA